MMRRTIIAVCFWLMCGGLLDTARGQATQAAQPQAEAPPAAIKFRKYYIPDEAKTELTSGYRPLRHDKFDELLSEVRRKAASEQSQVYLVGARYFAVADGPLLRDGFALLDFHNPSSVPISARISPLELSIGSPVWELPDRAPAILGADSGGAHWVIVPQTGRLILPWTLRGQPQRIDRYGFRLRLPSSPTNQLVVAVKDGFVPQTEQGIVAPWEGDPLQWSNMPEASGLLTAAAPEAPYQLWLIDFGGNAEVSFSVVPADQAAEVSPFVTVRQADQYNLLASRLELQSEITLDVYRRGIDGLQLLVDKSLELLDARLGEDQVSWISEDVDNGSHVRYQLQFPRPLLGPNHVLRLTLHAALTTDDPWQLPKVRCPDTFWHEGRIDLTVPSVIELQQLDLQHCVQTRSNTLPEGGEVLSLQCYRPDFEARIRLRHRSAALQVQMGTAVRLDTEVVTARAVADVRTTWGEMFVLRARVPKPWFIDRVEAEPSGALDSSSGSWRLDDGVLEISLRQPVTTQPGLRLIIEGHRVAPPAGSGLTMGHLDFLRLNDVADATSLLRIHAAAPLQVKLSGDAEVPRIDPSTLSAAELRRLGDTAEGVVFKHETSSSSLTAQVVRDTPKYVADVRMQAEVRDQSLIETYVIRCAPESLAVREVLVRISRTRSAPLVWRLAGSDEPLTARQFGADPDNDPADAGESWQIELPAEQSTAFELHGQRISEFNGPTALALAGLPQAVSESGRVTIRSQMLLGIQADGPEQLPPEPPPAGRHAPLRGVFRYQPSHTDQLVIAPGGTPVTATAWAWAVEYSTYLSQDGQANHQALFRLQNAGSSQVVCRLPAGLRALEIHVDGRTIDVEQPAPQEVSLPLPTGAALPSVRIRYATVTRPGLWNWRVQVPMPTLNVPSVAARWLVFAPAGYRMASSSQRLLVPRSGVASLQRRLLGPLAARASGSDGPGPQSLLLADATAPVAKSVQSLPKAVLAVGETSQVALADAVAQMQVAAPRGVVILLDAPALATLGLQPTSIAFTASEGEQGPTVAQMLAALDLCMLVGQQHLLITSREMAGGLAEQLQSDPLANAQRSLFAVRPHGWLWNLLDRPDATAAGFVHVSSWPAWAQAQVSPWSRRVVQADGTASGQWLRLPFSVDPDQTAGQLVLLRYRHLALAAWCAFLVAASIVWWAGRHVASLIVAAIAATAMLLPPLWINVGAASFLGGVTAWLLLAVYPSHPPLKLVPGDASSKTLLRAAAVFALLLLAWVPLQAQEPGNAADRPAATTQAGNARNDDNDNRDADRQANTRTVEKAGEENAAVADGARAEFRVMIPVDAERQPLGPYLYIPNSLYEYIFRYLEADVAPYEWLLHRARYVAQVDAGSASEPFSISSFSATYALETFAPGQIVRIPLRRSEVQILDAKLDGQAAEVRWSSDESHLLVTVPERRLHELTLTLSNRRRDAAAVLDVAVPEVAHCVLVLNNLPGGVTLEAIGALGEARRVNGRLEFDLGPAERLSLRRVEVMQSTEMTRLDVEQWQWLRVRPNAMVLDARWNFSAQGPRPDRIILRLDSRLRLLPLAPGQPVEGEPVVASGDYQQIELALKEGIGQRFTLNASFLVSNSSGLGQIRLPRAEVLNAQVTRRMLAVSYPPAVQLTDVRAPQLRPIQPSVFLQGWGRDGEVPQQAYEPQSVSEVGELDWVAESRYTPAETVANQQFRIRVSQDRLHITLDALLDSSGSPIFQRVISGTTGINIDRISVFEGDTQLAARFADDGQGRCVVFLPAAAGSRQRLRLHGWMAVQQRTVATCPLLTIADARLESSRVEIYRQPDVQSVEVQGAEDWTPRDVGATSSTDSLLVGIWSVPEPSERPIKLTIRPNARHAEGFLATRLVRTATGWLADVEYHLLVHEGVFDTVRLEIPADWPTPLQIEPDIPFELRALPGQGRQQLILRPDAPVTKSLTFRLQSSLTTSGDRIRRVPDLVPLDVSSAQRFLVLPTRLEAQQIAWATSGLQARGLPDIFRMAAQPTDAWEAYQVTGPQFHASIRHVERVAGLPQIRLADVHVNLDARHYSGVASFDIEPAGRTECRLSVPAGVELLHVAVRGLTAELEKVEPDELRVQLGFSQLPLRVDVVFRGELKSPATRDCMLAVPWCTDLTAARTLWTVRYPWRLGALRAESNAAVVSAREQETIRLESLASLVDLSIGAAVENGSEEAVHWLRPWSSRMTAARQRLQFEPDVVQPSEAEPLQQRLTVAEQTWISVIDRLNEVGSQTITDQLVAPTADLAELLRREPADLQQQMYLSFPGQADSLVLQQRTSSHGMLYRIVCAGLLMASGVGVQLARSKGLRCDLVAEFPLAMLALAGLAWRLWLSPPWIGWLLMGLAVVGTLLRRSSAGQR